MARSAFERFCPRGGWLTCRAAWAKARASSSVLIERSCAFAHSAAQCNERRDDRDHLQALRVPAVGGGAAARGLCGGRCGSARWIHPFLHLLAGARDGSEALCRCGRPCVDCRRCTGACERAQMGAFPRRRSISPSLSGVAPRGSAVDARSPSRFGRAARISGTLGVIGLLEPLVQPLLRMLDAEDAHRLALLALKLPPFVK